MAVCALALDHLERLMRVEAARAHRHGVRAAEKSPQWLTCASCDEIPKRLIEACCETRNKPFFARLDRLDAKDPINLSASFSRFGNLG
jgi:hypothetical protein